MDLEARPHTLQEFQKIDNLTVDSSESAANLEIDSDEEIWIFNIPKTIDPKDLKNKKLQVKKKITIDINEKEYEIVKQKTTEEPLPCVHKNNDGKLEVVMIKPEKTMQFIRKI